MKTTPLPHAPAAWLCAALATAASLAQAQLVNGSLTGPIANGGVPPGWTVLAGSPDTMDAGNNVGVPGLLDFGVPPSATPDGGTWVGIGSSVGFVETFGQSLGGLKVGSTYSVSWVAGNFGFSPTNFQYVNPNAVDVRLDGTSVGTGATIALGPDWFAQSVTFTATATTQLLAFQLATDAKSYMSVDGISVSAVPEPRAATLMMLGLAAAGWAVGRRRSPARR